MFLIVLAVPSLFLVAHYAAATLRAVATVTTGDPGATARSEPDAANEDREPIYDQQARLLAAE